MTTQTRPTRDDAVQKATHLFWEKGFHATSMRQLQEHIDMRPGSIYAAFGNKEGLYKEALQSYTNQGLEQLRQCIQGSSSPLEGLKAFIRFMVLDSHQSAPSEMCLLVKSIAELTDDNTELLCESKRLLATIEMAFADILIEAQQQNEISADKDPVRLSRFLQTQLIGLRAYAKANGTENISELIDDAFACFN